jgi:hypothetical protein
MNCRSALAVVLLCGASTRSLGDEAQTARARALGETFMKMVDALDAGARRRMGKRGSREFLDSGGPLHGHVLAREQDLSGRFIKLDYLALGERKPLYIELVFYRPDKDWKLYSWGWYGDARELFGPRLQNK